jgi:hypothetical protein
MFKPMVGETRKNFSTSLGEKKNELALSYKNINKTETN